MPIQSFNPATNTLVKTFQAHSDAQIANKLQKSQKAFSSWKDTSFKERADLLLKCASLLLSEKDKYATLITLEMGKVIMGSRAEIEKCALGCQYYAENAEAFLADEHVKTDAKESFIMYNPLGILLAIMPWNFPFWQLFRFACPAIMGGNVVVLKHASNVPQCALALEELFLKAGFPEGVFQTILLEGGEINKVIADDRIMAVTLTGSEAAGSKVAEIAGKHLKKCVLELGGSDPFIVLADANLEAAAKTAAKARMMNSGQSCISSKRFIIEKPIEEEFTRLFTKSLSELKQGDPLSEDSDYGPLASAAFASGLQQQFEKSIQAGALLVSGTGKAENAYFKPTLISNVKPGMPAYEEELFGPVASIITAKDAKDAVRIANDNRYGLGASLWTSDMDKAKSIARQIESGTIFVNTLLRSDPRLPFGGIKKSGYGRELSYLGIREFMNIKSVSIS